MKYNTTAELFTNDNTDDVNNHIDVVANPLIKPLLFEILDYMAKLNYDGLYLNLIKMDSMYSDDLHIDYGIVDLFLKHLYDILSEIGITFNQDTDMLNIYDVFTMLKVVVESGKMLDSIYVSNEYINDLDSNNSILAFCKLLNNINGSINEYNIYDHIDGVSDSITNVLESTAQKTIFNSLLSEVDVTLDVYIDVVRKYINGKCNNLVAKSFGDALPLDLPLHEVITLLPLDVMLTMTDADDIMYNIIMYLYLGIDSRTSHIKYYDEYVSDWICDNVSNDLDMKIHKLLPTIINEINNHLTANGVNLYQ